MNTSRARILRGLDGARADGRAPPSGAELVMRADHRHLRAALDLDGAAMPPPGDGATALDRDSEAFVHAVLTLLDTHRRAADFDRLAVIAPPEMMDILEREMSPLLRRRLARAWAVDPIGLSSEALLRIVRDGGDGSDPAKR
ncbi:host attachment protein [Acidimangrovimonas pyrenivorans]|uniref:Host attachment protein n=1 Tax=Acidimangrovimonas pyrenivorans TaxID=2030798 RepID=A0ABV7AKA1_9RHOB